MSDPTNGSTQRPQPSDPHRWCSGKHDSHDYLVEFYPGFASHIRLDSDGAEGTVLYKQGETHPEKTFVLPPGASRPLSSHAMQLSSSTRNFTVGLHIDDPQHVVESIVVKLRDPAAGGGGATGSAGGGVMAYQAGGGTTWTTENTPTICPPTC